MSSAGEGEMAKVITVEEPGSALQGSCRVCSIQRIHLGSILPYAGLSEPGSGRGLRGQRPRDTKRREEDASDKSHRAKLRTPAGRRLPCHL